MSFIDSIKIRAKKDIKTIVLPEGNDIRTIEAVEKVRKEQFADVIVLGNKDKSRIVEIIEEYIKTKQKKKIIYDLTKVEFEKMEITNFDSHTRAFVKIQDGCNAFCSYCIIPYVRGRVRSKDPEDVIKEVICGNEKSKGIIQEGQYKEYLLKCINDIVSAFTETENRNLRIIRSWIFSFRKIYEATTKYYSSSKYYEEILNDFLRYSIWVTGAIKKNKKTNYGSQDMVYFEGHEYTHIFRYSFIDAWINRDVWSDEDLSQACKSIIKRREQEDVDNPPKIHSTGKALNELRDWYLMEDEQVEEVLEKLVHEVEEGKYAYYDYSNILSTLLYLQVNGLFTGDIKKIQTKMIDMIKKDLDVQEENDFHKNFSSEEIRDKYNELYRPIAEERKIRNREINKEEQEESDIYRSADVFYEHCRKMANYYCIHKSFIEYLDLDKLLALINISNNEDIYTILQAFKTVYFMGNLKDFYMADVQGIKRIIEGVKDDDIVKQGGITRKIALRNFVESLKKDLILLGVEE